MRAPGFWSQRGIVSTLLAPLGTVTAAITARRVARPGFDPTIPVFCAGNAGVGGSGKTILARDLLLRLPGTPFALTRGHGGKRAGPLRVDPARHRPEDVGDEALLLAATGPAILARDRAAGARLALAEGATAIIMDDGLQNPGLRKTFSFLVIDGGYGFGNGRLLPAGPLREPVAAAAARCDAAVLIGPDTANALAALPAGLPVWRAELVPACATPLGGVKVFAFAGIGRPEKFFASVRSLGAELAGVLAFGDHHPYTARDAAVLLEKATALNARLVTTEKDFIKLPPALQAVTLVVTVRLSWADEAGLTAFLRLTTDH
jgi:tetraacyldisaccharide 4'-kinase